MSEHSHDRRGGEADRGEEALAGGADAACLDRVGELDGELHAFVLLTEERALADARAAEAAIMAGNSIGPLCGIPIGLKDIVDTKGIARRVIRRSCATTCPTPMRPVR